MAHVEIMKGFVKDYLVVDQEWLGILQNDLFRLSPTYCYFIIGIPICALMPRDANALEDASGKK